MTPPEPKASRWSWKTLLQLAFALLLLAVVARSVPWRDRLVWTEGGQEVAVAGAIEGDWKSDAITFRIDPEDPDRGAAPFAAADAEGRLAVSRDLASGPDAGGFSWQPGMPRVFRELDPRGLALCLAALCFGQTMAVTRWWRLLAVAGCATRWWNALRLTFLGLFFNLLVPGGLTGGDVVKSVLVAREHPERKTRAFISVYVDRLLGLLALALLAAVVILTQGDAFSALRGPVLLFLAGGIVGGLIYANRPLRRLVRFDAIVAKLPLSDAVRKLDDAFLLYSRHPLEIALALVFSLANHVAAILGIFALGRAFGDDLALVTYFVVVPIGNTVSALPGAPGGWGVGEAAYAFLFPLVGGSATMGIAVSVTFRLCMMLLGLVGGLLLLVHASGLSWRQIEAIEESERSA